MLCKWNKRPIIIQKNKSSFCFLKIANESFSHIIRQQSGIKAFLFFLDGEQLIDKIISPSDYIVTFKSILHNKVSEISSLLVGFIIIASPSSFEAPAIS